MLNKWNKKQKGIIQVMKIVRKCTNILKKILHKIIFRIKLWKMDKQWELMGGRCWQLFPPSFYYTHTEEEIEQAINEVKEILESYEKNLDE